MLGTRACSRVKSVRGFGRQRVRASLRIVGLKAQGVLMQKLREARDCAL